MTSSPFLTLTGARSPVSRRLPSPTLRTLPRLGFSLAVSGRTMPDLVLDSASTRLTRILSPRGRSLAIVDAPCFERNRYWRFDIGGLMNGVTTQPQTSNLKPAQTSQSFFRRRRPAALVVASQDSRERVEQLVEINGLGK